MNLKLRCVLFVALTSLSFGQLFGQATYTSTGTTSNWSQTTTWSIGGTADGDGNGLPDANDHVIINGHAVNMNGTNACLNMTINGAGSLTFTGNNTLTVNGNLTMNGTSQILSDASGTASRLLSVAGTFSVPAGVTNARIGDATHDLLFTITGATTIDGVFSCPNNTDQKVKTFKGNVTVSSTGSWTSTNSTATGNLIFNNGVSSSGTFAAGGATFSDLAGSAATNTQTLGGTGPMSFSGIVTLSDGAVAGALSVTNSNTNTVTISGTGAAQLTGTAGASWIQGANSTLSYAGTTITTITFNASSNVNSVIYTNATAPTTIVSFSSLTYSGSGTLTLATPTISGNLTVNTGNFTPTGNTTLNGTSTQTIGGTTGSITIPNLILSATAGGAVNIDRSITLSGGAGALDFTSGNNRKIILGTSGNITLSNTAGTILNADADSYVQSDGLSGSSGNLIYTTANSATSSWLNEFPVGTAIGGYKPMDLGDLAGVGNVAPALNATLSVKAIYSGSNQGQLRRVFRMTVAGNGNATFFRNGVFNYYDHATLQDDISDGDAEGNYSTCWYLKIPNGSWANVAVTLSPGSDQFSVDGGSTATANLATGTYYYTIGAATAYPNTWYSYQTGVWSNYLNWTLDPSISTPTFSNPLGLPPVPGDQIVIQNGFTITNDVNSQVASTTVINGGGTLDMAATTGNTLGTSISGTGLLRVKGVSGGVMALPSGTYTSFVSTAGGTIEYYDATGTLPTSQPTYNKLKLTNTTGAAITFTTISNLTVNSTLDITGASASNYCKWQINDASTTQLSISLLGTLTVGTGGRIGVGTGVPAVGPHALSMSADITNNGVIKFYDEADAGFNLTDYLTNTGAGTFYKNAQNNSVNVTYSNTGDNTIDCQGITDFYRLIVNKGTGPGAVLTVNSSTNGNFRLLSPVNDMTSPSLSLVNGTLQLTGSMSLGYLVLTNDQYTIPTSAALWVNGSGVIVNVTDNSTKAQNHNIFLDGILHVTSGTVNCGNSEGLIGGDAGTVIIDGGTLKTWQLRSNSPSTGNFNYTQSAGSVYVAADPAYGLDGGKNSGAFPRFALGSATATFSMSGGDLYIGKPTADGGIEIGSGTGYYSATGGTVRIHTGHEGSSGTERDFTISTTSPFYNCTITRETLRASSKAALLETYKLKVLNDLTIDNTGSQTPGLTCANLNVEVGGNFDIQSGTTFTPGTDTLTFNGSGAQVWTYTGTITSLNHVVVNKSAGTLSLTSAGSLPNIGNGTIGGLTITSGIMEDNGETINVNGAVLSNSGTHKSTSGTGAIVVLSTAPLTGIDGTNGTFGNLTINKNANLTTSGDQTVTGNLRLTGGTNCSLNISSNALTVNGTIFDYNGTTTAFGINTGNLNYIITSGLHNAGGLTRKGSNAADVLFPVGTTSYYTPATINATATTTGTITVRNVSAQHPNVAASNVSLQYYWRVTSSGYSAISAVTHKSYNFYTSTLLGSGVKTAYRVARWDISDNAWDYTNPGTFNATGTSVITQTGPITTFNTGTGWFGVTGDQLDGEFTWGDVTAFAVVKTYYSRLSGAWNLATTWSTDATNKHNGAQTVDVVPPCGTCPVVIGDATHAHTVTVDANSRQSGSLAIYGNSTLDCNTRTTLNFGTFVSNADGTHPGTLKVSSTEFPAGDFTNFISSTGGTMHWYGAAKTIPGTGNAPQSLNLSKYYNLIVSPDAGADIILPDKNLTIYNNVTVSGVNTTTSRVLNNTSTANRTISIGGDLTVSSGKLYMLAAFRLNFTVTGLTTINANGSFVADPSGTKSHTFTTSSGIVNDGTLDFNGASTNVINLVLNGSSNVSLSGSGNGDFNNITVNKGSSSATTATLSMATATAPSHNWLSINTGTFEFANTGTYSLRTSGNFSIVSGTRLKVTSGTVNIISAGTGDLLLTGELWVAGGAATVANGTNQNDIEYSAAEISYLTISSGSLWVNGQIRRPTNTTVGSLVYNQTGGSVTVSGQNPNNTRGVFEIANNTGSSFTLTGNSTLTIERDTDGTSYADLYLDPETSNVAATSTIVVGLSSEPTNAIRVDIKPDIGNFTVVGGGTAQTATLQNNDLVLLGSLTVPTPSTFIASSLDVSIAGNLSCTGTYTSGTNTTTFNGSDAQSAVLSGTSSFYNLTVNNSGTTPNSDKTVTLSGTAPTSLNDLSILAGILDVGTMNLPVNGNVTNNSTEIATGASVANGYIVLSTTATAHTITSGNGSFAKLKLAPDASFPTTTTITVNGNATITGDLNFNTPSTYVYFFIGGNLLSFSSAATISNAGTNKFIKTNGVSSDLGVLRNWTTGAGTFTYAVGTRVNYTPVIFTGMVVGTAGTLKVIPVDDPHPTQDNTGNLLLVNYYWSLSSTLTPSGAGSVVFQAPNLLLGGTFGTAFNGAYLDVNNLNGLNGWVTPAGTLNDSTNPITADPITLTFSGSLNTYVPQPAGNKSIYEYTMGDPSRLPSPIPFVYSRFSNADGSSPTTVSNVATGGNWSDPNSWTLATNGMGAALTTAPTNRPIFIIKETTGLLRTARINLDANFKTAPFTTLNGLLYAPATVGHNLGTITGTGTLRTANSTMPAGTYTAFVAATGGTIEYDVANMATPTMNNIATYNNLTAYGSTGTLTMTASNLTVNGNLTINSGVTVTNAANNADIDLAKNWANSGTFTPGTGDVTFNGTVAQAVSGTNAFYDVTINKTSGNVSLGTGSTSVSNLLTLTKGHIVSTSTNTLALGSSATVSPTPSTISAVSFVDGPMTKSITIGGSFIAPLGSVTKAVSRPATIANTGASATWSFQYFGHGPTADTYTSTAVAGTIKSVSIYEYWKIAPTAGTPQADVTVTFGPGSYSGGNILSGGSSIANLRLVRWGGSSWDVPPNTLGSNTGSSADNMYGSTMATNVTSFSPLTNGSVDAPHALPIELLYFRGRLRSEGVELSWETATEIQNDYFTLEKSANGEKFSNIAKIPGAGTSQTPIHYEFIDRDLVFGTSYYRLKQTDFDGKSETFKVISIDYHGEEPVYVSIYPNPADHQDMHIEIAGFRDITSVPITVTDQLGRQVIAAQVTIDPSGGINAMSLSTEPLASGVYFIKIGTLVKRIIVVK